MQLRLSTIIDQRGVEIRASYVKGGETYNIAKLVPTELLTRRGYADEAYYLNRARTQLTAEAIRHYYGE